MSADQAQAIADIEDEPYDSAEDEDFQVDAGQDESELSSDEEADAEPAKKKKRGKKKAVQLDEEYFADDGGEYYADDGAWGGGTVPASLDEAGPAVLDYGETDAVGDGAVSFDWDHAERLWDSKSTVLTGPEQLVAGALVGWKVHASFPTSVVNLLLLTLLS